jgi:hypothetical protein
VIYRHQPLITTAMLGTALIALPILLRRRSRQIARLQNRLTERTRRMEHIDPASTEK